MDSVGGTSAIRLCPVGRKNFSCRMEELFLSERKIFPVGRKNFSCWKEKLFLKVGQKVLNFRKFEWFTDGQLEKFFLSDGKIFPVGWKSSSCRMEGLGMPEGFDEAIYLIELLEPSEVKRKNKE